MKDKISLFVHSLEHTPTYRLMSKVGLEGHTRPSSGLKSDTTARDERRNRYFNKETDLKTGVVRALWKTPIIG